MELLHWFNPAIWLIKQELQNIHEYEADEYVLSKGIDKKRYQLLLIEKAVGSQCFASMANSFNHSKLKSRITMMLKSKSNPWARLKYLYILPLSAVVVAAFARPEISRELEKTLPEKVVVRVTNDSTAITVNAGQEAGLEPLILLNGIEISREMMDAISPERIEQITVLKNEDSIWLYGEKGKGGVILITTHRINYEFNPEGTEVAMTNHIHKKGAEGISRFYVDAKEVTQKEFEAIDPATIKSMHIDTEEDSSSPTGTVKILKLILIP
ncbi:MAG: hypothetical protein LIP01_14950 [Tannerellaceae bacterium]|nr:hypothetical protein [Tannerellaceae bacterium]